MNFEFLNMPKDDDVEGTLQFTINSPEQSEKAQLPIDVTLFGIVNIERLEQPQKAYFPIVVTGKIITL